MKRNGGPAVDLKAFLERGTAKKREAKNQTENEGNEMQLDLSLLQQPGVERVFS